MDHPTPSAAPVLDPAGIPALTEAIAHLHGARARFVEWVRVADTFQGAPVFDTTVGVFELTGFAAAQRAYAWSEPAGGKRRRFFAVLHAPPVDGPLAAVRASIAKDARSH